MRISDGAISWDDFDEALDDLAQEFLRQFVFNTVIDVSRRELEALSQGPEESRSALLEDCGPKSSPFDSKGKKSSGDKDQEMWVARSFQAMTPTYLHPTSEPGFAAQLGMPLSRAFQKLMKGHDTNHCTALRHAIQDLIDQGLVNLGATHSTHAVPPPSGGIHHIDFVEDDSIHILSWDDGLLESIVLDDGYEVNTMGSQTSTTVQFDFRLARPFDGVISHEEVMREDDELLRQLQSTQARISIWSLLASSSTHRDALIRVLNDDLPPEGFRPYMPFIYHSRLFRAIEFHPSCWINGSALNVHPLATTIALGYASSKFGLSTQMVRAYDSTKGEVVGTLMIELLIGPATFSTLFQVIMLSLLKICLPLPSRCFTSVIVRMIYFLPGFTFDEVQTLELGQRQHGPMEFVATTNHDTLFGLGLFLQRLIIEDTTDYGVVVEPTKVTDGVVPHDKLPKRSRQFLLQELMEDVTVGDDLFEGTISSIEGTSDFMDPLLSFDILSGFISRSDDVYDSSSMDFEHFRIMRLCCPIQIETLLIIDSNPIDERVSPIIGDVEIVDFSTENRPKELKIGSLLSTDESDRLIHLLSLAPLAYLATCQTGQVELRDDKVRVCVAFRDLNKASPNDDFLLPYIDLLVDSTIGHSMLSFMDGFSGYNQILMASDDMEKTTFITECGTYYYRVIPFGLRNAGATYQRVATTLFHDMMHRNVEVYVDDMIVKSRGRADHLVALEKFFEKIRNLRLRLNPKKCTFGVTFGKLLGHMVSERGIEIDLNKIKVILDMSVLRTEKEIMGFLGSVSLGHQEIETLHDKVFSALGFSPRSIEKSIKESIVVDHLASLPIFVGGPVDDDFPYKEFIGMTSLSDQHLATNNIVEYEACIFNLETALELGIRQMEVFGDSNLVLKQIQGDWRTRDVKLRPYHAYLELLVRRFDDLRYTHLPRVQNQFANALASSMDFPIYVVIRPLLIESRFAPAYNCLI
ncbi:Transposon Ty3-G Gag-Pol polyprotein [Vitis vinifera]|uniref:Transposon Ty3-G Gag-Pol polyprotein n=1 Tax=Vitis vinifera TaxID=29760 RepID=A0A438E8N3_VITVI|nr:Transposon Ty3-G Gag-Pol polyprotein [Vitis vinifera]